MINIKLKFIVDVGVSNKVEKWLTAQGFDVVNVRDIDPGLPDHEIVKIAAKENRMIITMDKDFGDLFIEPMLLIQAFYCFGLMVILHKKKSVLSREY